MSDVVDLLKARHSCRKFAKKDVPEDLLNKILEAGRLTASGRNNQEWRFHVVTTRSLSEDIGKKIDQIMFKENSARSEIPKKAGVTNAIFYDAPVVIFFSMYLPLSSETGKFDCGLAMQSMILEAQALGLCTLPVGLAMLYGSDIVKTALKLPADEEFVLSLCVGFQDPAVPLQSRDRKPLNEIAKFY